jgi:anti-sigma B factor antagonist
LNLAFVTSIDSWAFGELLSSQITLNNRGGELKLVHLTESLRLIMAVTKTLDVFDIFDTETEALASFRTQLVAVKQQEPSFA